MSQITVYTALGLKESLEFIIIYKNIKHNFWSTFKSFTLLGKYEDGGGLDKRVNKDI